MINSLRNIKNHISRYLNSRSKRRKLNQYISSGRVAWSPGYLEFRNDFIKTALDNLPPAISNWGALLDERVVEMPWVFSRLSSDRAKLLDAGSSLNHHFLLDHPLFKNKDLTICTYFPENYARHSQRISYVYADLRELPFKDEWFDEIVCISTIEHIDMDNSMYGYSNTSTDTPTERSYSYLTAIKELVRVLRPNGHLLVTFPFGKFENHGFFQQLDSEMVSRLQELLCASGESNMYFFKYSPSGWNPASLNECSEMESFNPHSGIGKKNDGAAHSRAIGCISFFKNS